TVPVPVVARAISAAPAAAISAASAAATATVVDVVDDSAVVTGRVAATAASPSAAHPIIRGIAVIHDGVAGVDVVSAANPPVAVATPIADAPIVAVARTGSVVGPAGPTATANLSTAAGSIAADAADRARKRGGSVSTQSGSVSTEPRSVSAGPRSITADATGKGGGPRHVPHIGPVLRQIGPRHVPHIGPVLGHVSHVGAILGHAWPVHGHGRPRHRGPVLGRRGSGHAATPWSRHAAACWSCHAAARWSCHAAAPRTCAAPAALGVGRFPGTQESE